MSPLEAAVGDNLLPLLVVGVLAIMLVLVAGEWINRDGCN